MGSQTALLFLATTACLASTAMATVTSSEGKKHDGFIYTIGYTQKNWIDAEADCVAWNGHLATIESSALNNFLYNMMRNVQLNRMWIGLNDRDNEGTLVWVSTGQPFIYDMPITGINGGSADCYVLKHPNTAWEVGDCSSRGFYVCQKEDLSTPVITDCGGNITSPSIIRYPASGNYPAGVHCVWNIRIGRPIVLKFNRLATEYDPLDMDMGACVDYVRIGAGGRVCGNTESPTENWRIMTIQALQNHTSDTGEMTLTFSSDSSEGDTGFEVEILVDSCRTNNGGCHQNAACTNGTGVVNCTCAQGFVGDGTNNGTGCTDINECATNRGGCHINAECINVPGSHNCTCLRGYTGNGTSCTGNCSNFCDVNETCHLIGNTPVCVCKDGLYKQSGVCRPIVNAFSSKLQLLEKFTEELGNPKSDEFRSLASKVEGALLLSLQTTLTNVEAVKVYAFHNGSVIASYSVIFGVDAVVNVSQLQSAIETGVSSGKLGELNVNPSFIPEIQVFSGCQYLSKDGCHSNARCLKYNDSYTCECVDGFYGNGFTCSVTARRSAELAVTVTCTELDLTATINKEMFHGNVTNMTVVNCPYDKYTADDNAINVRFEDCYGNITETEDQISQENTIAITAGQPDKTNTVHRLSTYYYRVQCMFDRRLNISHGQAVNVDPKQERFEKTSTTNFTANLTFFAGNSFSRQVSTPQVASFEPIYIQIRGVHNIQYFKLIAQDCYATPSGNPNDLSRYLFFAGKCAIDTTFAEHNPNTINTFSFSIQAFTFIALKKTVFFHCNLLVCKHDTNSTDCTQTCTDLRRKRRAVGDDGGLEVVVANSGPVEYKRKPSCNDITCQTNAHCVNLFPATCRCNTGFVLDQETNECSNTRLFTVRGLHLDMEFMTSYGDPASYEFLKLAATVERDLMSVYRLDEHKIKGIKVISASEGSVVLDIQIRHAKTVTSQEAFESFIDSVLKSNLEDNVSNIKRHLLPTLEVERLLKEEKSVGIIAIAVVCPLVIILLVTSIICVVWKKGKNNKEKVTGIENKAVSMETISA